MENRNKLRRMGEPVSVTPPASPVSSPSDLEKLPLSSLLEITSYIHYRDLIFLLRTGRYLANTIGLWHAVACIGLRKFGREIKTEETNEAKWDAIAKDCFRAALKAQLNIFVSDFASPPITKILKEWLFIYNTKDQDALRKIFVIPDEKSMHDSKTEHPPFADYETFLVVLLMEFDKEFFRNGCLSNKSKSILHFIRIQAALASIIYQFIKKIVLRKPNINATVANVTLLQWAILLNQSKEEVQDLIKLGASIYKSHRRIHYFDDSRFYSPAQPTPCELIFDVSKLPFSTYPIFFTVLTDAIAFGNLEYTYPLLEKIWEEKLMKPEEHMEICVDALCVAISTDNIPIIKCLVSCGTDYRAKNKLLDRRSALNSINSTMALNAFIDVAREVLNVDSEEKPTLLSLVALKANVTLVEAILHEQEEPLPIPVAKEIILAIDKQPEFHLLFDPDKHERFLRIISSLARATGSWGNLPIPMRNNYFINLITSYCKNPTFDKKRAYQALLPHVGIDYRDRHDRSPLHITLSFLNHKPDEKALHDLLDDLLRNRTNANTHPSNTIIQSVLSMAGNVGIAQKLIRAGANPNGMGATKGFPLVYAKSKAIMRFLLEEKADPNILISSSPSYTPLHYFIKRMNNGISPELDGEKITLLLEYKANPNFSGSEVSASPFTFFPIDTLDQDCYSPILLSLLYANANSLDWWQANKKNCSPLTSTLAMIIRSMMCAESERKSVLDTMHKRLIPVNIPEGKEEKKEGKEEKVEQAPTSSFSIMIKRVEKDAPREYRSMKAKLILFNHLKNTTAYSHIADYLKLALLSYETLYVNGESVKKEAWETCLANALQHEPEGAREYKSYLTKECKTCESATYSFDRSLAQGKDFNLYQKLLLLEQLNHNKEHSSKYGNVINQKLNDYLLKWTNGYKAYHALVDLGLTTQSCEMYLASLALKKPKCLETFLNHSLFNKFLNQYFELQEKINMSSSSSSSSSSSFESEEGKQNFRDAMIFLEYLLYTLMRGKNLVALDCDIEWYMNAAQKQLGVGTSCREAYEKIFPVEREFTLTLTPLSMLHHPSSVLEPPLPSSFIGRLPSAKRLL